MKTVKTRTLMLSPRGFLLAVVLFLSHASLGLAIDLKPDELRTDEEAKAVSVLQQRVFLKRFRPELGVMVGTNLNEAYTNTGTRGVRLSLFISELWGLEFQYLKTSISDSEDRDVLNKMKFRPLQDPVPGQDTIVTADPEVNAVHQIMDYNAIFAPFYGKLNLMDKLIMYTDMYLTAGGASVETDQGTKNAISIGVGQRFYIGKAWCARLDFRDRIFDEERAGQPHRKHSKHIDFGVSYFFL